jgi:hypothetical protein
MALHEAVINPPTRGAGRSFDIAYPAPQNFPVNNSTAPILVVDRQGYNQYTWGGYTGVGVAPAGTGWTLYRGRIAWRQTGDGTPSGGFWSTETTGTNGITFPQTKPTANFNNDFACWRVLAILAFDADRGTPGWR